MAPRKDREVSICDVFLLSLIAELNYRKVGQRIATIRGFRIYIIGINREHHCMNYEKSATKRNPTTLLLRMRVTF